MKQLNDTASQDMHEDGLPAFDLDHTHPWTLPPVKPYTPAPRELTLPERWRLNTLRRLGA